MKSINIASNIARKRKERNITQDELARYMGVSKASVSKWETGASFPDIVLLPQLATYFNISIDELMAYDPQMSPENIRQVYQRLTADVATKPFSSVLEECRELIRKYFSCYQLIYQMGLFLLNNIGMAEGPEQQEALTHEAIDLFGRVHEESDDPGLAQRALALKGYCYLGLGDANTTLALLEAPAREPLLPSDIIVASAHQMKGENEEARRFLQFGLYQNIVIHLNYLTNYLMLVIDEPEIFDETVKRARGVAEMYDLKSLHPVIYLGLELMIALGYAKRNQRAEALATLESYAQTIVENKVPFYLHGDAYFNLIESWLKDMENGDKLPMNATLLKDNLVGIVAEHPAFAQLKDEPRFKRIVSQLDAASRGDICCLHNERTVLS